MDAIEANVPTAAPLSIDIEYGQHVNFALQQNDIPVVRRLSVNNLCERRIEDISVRITSDPAVFRPSALQISAIDGGATYNHRDLALELSAERLAQQRGRERGTITAELRANGAFVGSYACPFEILAFNEWNGLRAVPELLAAFVLPNQPAVAEVLKRARSELRQHTLDDALDGYQSKNPQRVLRIVSSIYAAIQSLGISYVNPPASFEETGQKIRPPGQVLSDEMGTCLDLTTLIAAAMEQVGLNSLLVLTEGHAFVRGYWVLRLDCPVWANPDASRRPAAIVGRVLRGRALLR